MTYADDGPGFDGDVPSYGDYDYERPFKPVYGPSTVYPVDDGVYVDDGYDSTDYKAGAYLDMLFEY